MAGDTDRVRALERELEGARSRLRALDAKIAQNLVREHKTQQRLALAEALCSNALLAAGAARTMRHPLQYARLNLDYLLGELTQGQEIPADIRYRLQGSLSEARQTLLRLDEIVQAMTTEPDQPDGPAVTKDLLRVILASIRMAHAVVGSNARTTTEFEEMPPVRGHEARLAEVFFQLIANASEALAHHNRADPRILVRTRNDHEDGIVVTITDSGPGIPPEDLERIFEPFFTTKKEPGVPGLGLSLCRKLLDGMGGDIRAQSRQGDGATFVVRLSRAHEERSSGPPASAIRFAPTKPPVRRIDRFGTR